MSDVTIKAPFIEPMLLLPAEKLPEGGSWAYELKLDGYRAEAIKSGRRLHLRSRNDKDFAQRYSAIALALAEMPDETVIDGEIVALDESGRPSFSALQNHASTASTMAGSPNPDTSPTSRRSVTGATIRGSTISDPG